MKTDKKPWYKRWTIWTAAFLIFTAFSATMGALLPPPEEAAPVVYVEKADSTEATAKAAEKEAKKAKKAEAEAAKEKADAEAEKLRKETEQAAVDKTLAEFETFKQLLIENSDGIITDVTVEYGSYYKANVFVDETTWAVSSESEKESFATTVSTAIKTVLDDTALVDIRSATNNDIVAEEKVFGGYDIKR
ncbi:hypothetical protein [Psychrobacillus sp. OK032]|uniref:hypothetical protein n=1 Tax=Psychrobacillus sp. OK032 TaxID=1884358 RepID=UPI0008AC5F11|nr:hypothetical protein [Psychrobacillus sp. OK032]SER88730.1 hypothetical protein SAMN05518872_102504 [Psychrobacillus sp. OK032]